MTPMSVVLTLVLSGLLVLAGAFVVVGWHMAEGVAMSGHGIFALLLGVTLTLALAGVLIWLVHFSNRNNYDQ